MRVRTADCRTEPTSRDLISRCVQWRGQDFGWGAQRQRGGAGRVGVAGGSDAPYKMLRAPRQRAIDRAVILRRRTKAAESSRYA